MRRRKCGKADRFGCQMTHKAGNVATRKNYTLLQKGGYEK